LQLINIELIVNSKLITNNRYTQINFSFTENMIDLLFYLCIIFKFKE